MSAVMVITWSPAYKTIGFRLRNDRKRIQTRRAETWLCQPRVSETADSRSRTQAIEKCGIARPKLKDSKLEGVYPTEVSVVGWAGTGPLVAEQDGHPGK